MKTVNILLRGVKVFFVLGDFTYFMLDTFRACPSLWKRRKLFLQQCEFIGVTSLGIVTLAAIFFGAVLGYQLYVGFHWFGAESLLGGSVGVGIFREFAAVMSAYMVTGRAGAAMAAHIATMHVTEQVDALEVMAVDPFEYLVVPRVVAGFLMLPLLGVFFSVIGSLAASVIACGVMGLSSSTFWYQYSIFVDKVDLLHCVVKSFIFGGLLTWIGCFCGFRVEGGAKAVGFATRATVVASLVMILLFDYILTSLLPFGFYFLEV